MVFLLFCCQAVEIGLDESSQILALQCLIHTSSVQDCISQSTELLDYKLLSRVLHSDKCLLSRNMTMVRSSLSGAYLPISNMGMFTC